MPDSQQAQRISRRASQCPDAPERSRGWMLGSRSPYSACTGSMRLKPGSGIFTPFWQIGSSILTP